jgi:D-glycero-D-manno-heptose 1,7-bisphosphate phosphatase
VLSRAAADFGQLYAEVVGVKAAVIFERDGILNRVRVERQHQVVPIALDEFHVMANARKALEDLKEIGFVLLVTTNQPGISRGYLARRELDLMHDRLRRSLPLDGILVCPHDEMDGCPCRKPKSGLLREAAFRWQLDLERSFVVSDKWQDAEAARQVGCTSLLIRSPWNGSGHHDFVLSTLAEVVQRILLLQASPVLLMDEV